MMPAPRRKNIRLEGFDYSSEGSYFVTLVTKTRECLFGEIVNDEMVLSNFGKIVVEEWERSASIRNEIELGVYVVMPNHFHGIVHIFNDQQNKISPMQVGVYGHNLNTGKGDRPVAPTDGDIGLIVPKILSTHPQGPRPKSLGALVAGFKSSVTTRINTIRRSPGVPLWQRNFFDHIIGTDREYEQVAEYILDNPLKWAFDEENRITPGD